MVEIATGERPASKALDEIIREAKRLEESTLYSMKGHHVASNGWSNRNLWLGLPVVVISALVGATTFSQYAETYPALKVVAGLLSVAVAVLSGITTFLNPNDKESAHLSAAHGFDKLNNDARLFWSVDCWQEASDVVLTSQLKELVERKNELNSNSPQIPGWAYRRAKAGIIAGEAKFEVDNPAAPAALLHQAAAPADKRG
ncbi:SLATT domain-containing protein [Bradyrhizobium sp. CW7]|uniref:SLATT domain-containing protein n=1 Tax=Bradyrhizobium sp. CW7 TaxID=2782688 RepID=UPI001FF972C9|nr:SLATT domain-containing protein [Bradyrhizobium sp. CW7]MCK1354637.1 SLATT domain-containing protein [Bradyrhizobium sp. CW7]